MTGIGRLREEVAAAYAELGRSGLVSHTTGNVSALDRESGLVALTPTGGRPGLGPGDVSVVALRGGDHRDGPPPTSELPSHLALLRAGAGAVVHTHQPHAVAIALVADHVPLLLAEQAIDCGGPVRVLPYEPTGSEAMAAALEQSFRAAEVRAVCLRHHGPFAWGPTLERALASAFALEEAARAWLLARAAGAEPLRLPAAEADRLRPQAD